MRMIARRFSTLLLTSAAVSLMAAPAHAEVQLSAYTGGNTNFASKVKVNKGAIHDSRTVDWDGKSLEKMPPYWGLRATYWMDNTSPWGVALDYTHQKAYADINFAADPVYDHLEFTDGNNIVTLNAMYRLQQPTSAWSYYAGAGAGVAIPSVEVTLDGVAQKTHELQITGVAAQVLAGAQYKLTDSLSAFGEGKLTYTQNNGELDGGGDVKTHLWSPHALVGLSYSFY